MATKSTVQAQITARQTGIGNTATTERALWTSFLNELWTTEKREQNASGTNTILNASPAVSGLTFDLWFKKVGSTVLLKGFITNGSGSPIFGGTTIINITNSVYQKLSGSSGYVLGILAGSGGSSSIEFDGSTIKTNALGLDTGEILVVNGTYTANDN